jgi:hypothetical protein
MTAATRETGTKILSHLKAEMWWTDDLHLEGTQKEPEDSQDHVYNPRFKAHNYYAPQLCVAAASRADEAVSLAHDLSHGGIGLLYFPRLRGPTFT